MRILNPKSRPLLLFALIASAGYGQQIPEAIDLQAASSTYDRETGHLVFREVTISQGDMSVSANLAEATELEFENAAWIFTGNVKIRAEEALISGEKAVINFQDHRLVSASISGQPATINWESSKNDEAITGQANELIYNRESGTLTLTGDAVLSSGISEISGSTLLYDFNAEQIIAGSPDDESQGVRITITPEETTDKQSAKTRPAEPAAASEDQP
ncbi:MAG: lipopolysaccharide transport periplasmic protein LptA [Proteobacteria bacterium]|nr:lipopolysaccharide transport periplasmic protein LptA [Pseudomonadota bacterium]